MDLKPPPKEAGKRSPLRTGSLPLKKRPVVLTMDAAGTDGSKEVAMDASVHRASKRSRTKRDSTVDDGRTVSSLGSYIKLPSLSDSTGMMDAAGMDESNDEEEMQNYVYRAGLGGRHNSKRSDDDDSTVSALTSYNMLPSIGGLPSMMDATGTEESTAEEMVASVYGASKRSSDDSESDDDDDSTETASSFHRTTFSDKSPSTAGLLGTPTLYRNAAGLFGSPVRRNTNGMSSHWSTAPIGGASFLPAAANNTFASLPNTNFAAGTGAAGSFGLPMSRNANGMSSNWSTVPIGGASFLPAAANNTFASLPNTNCAAGTGAAGSFGSPMTRNANGKSSNMSTAPIGGASFLPAAANNDSFASPTNPSFATGTGGTPSSTTRRPRRWNSPSAPSFAPHNQAAGIVQEATRNASNSQAFKNGTVLGVYKTLSSHDRSKVVDILEEALSTGHNKDHDWIKNKARAANFDLFKCYDEILQFIYSRDEDVPKDLAIYKNNKTKFVVAPGEECYEGMVSITAEHFLNENTKPTVRNVKEFVTNKFVIPADWFVDKPYLRDVRAALKELKSTNQHDIDVLAMAATTIDKTNEDLFASQQAFTEQMNRSKERIFSAMVNHKKKAP